MAAQTFSESWYRIAEERVALRPHVQVRRQFYRGERFHVLHDPLNNQFFRLRPAAYAFVARLRMEQTVEEVWRECLDAAPEEAPGQEQVLRLLSQLSASNLLHSRHAPDVARMAERQQKQQGRQTRSTLLNIMFARFPVFDPDRLLKRILPALRWIISPLGALVWLAVIGAAVKTLVDHSALLRDGTQAVLGPGNLPLLYAALVGVKVLHEFGHTAMCRRFGGEVHVVGIMLMIFTPLPFVDTTSSWAFRSRWQRALVGAGGMIVELFLAALAVFVWAGTAPGALHSLAFNIVFLASLSTLLFNGNPLLRFDGYYILSDVLEIPNLQGRAVQQVGYVVERFLFGIADARSPAASLAEAGWLFAYGVGSLGYRLVLSAGILLFLANHYLLVGLLAMGVGVVTWGVVPLAKGAHYLAASPRLARHRTRALAVSAVALALAVAALGIVPAPRHFRAPGVLEAAEHSVVSTQVAGQVLTIVGTSGSEVTPGQPLLRLENRELELEIEGAAAEIAEAQAMRGRALEEVTADLQPIDRRIEAVEKRLARLRDSQAALTVRAPHAGVWVAPGLEEVRGTWLPRGHELGLVVNLTSFSFSAVVSQQEAARLFEGNIRSAQVRLAGQSALTLPVVGQRIIPAERRQLPSAALGWQGGGGLAVSGDDKSGREAKERFFEVRAQVEPPPGIALIHGRSGQLRFELPPQPLLGQWWRRLQQLLQQRGAA